MRAKRSVTTPVCYWPLIRPTAVRATMPAERVSRVPRASAPARPGTPTAAACVSTSRPMLQIAAPAANSASPVRFARELRAANAKTSALRATTPVSTPEPTHSIAAAATLRVRPVKSVRQVSARGNVTRALSSVAMSASPWPTTKITAERATRRAPPAARARTDPADARRGMKTAMVSASRPRLWKATPTTAGLAARFVRRAQAVSEASASAPVPTLSYAATLVSTRRRIPRTVAAAAGCVEVGNRAALVNALAPAKEQAVPVQAGLATTLVGSRATPVGSRATPVGSRPARVGSQLRGAPPMPTAEQTATATTAHVLAGGANIAAVPASTSTTTTTTVGPAV